MVRAAEVFHSVSRIGQVRRREIRAHLLRTATMMVKRWRSNVGLSGVSATEAGVASSTLDRLPFSSQTA